MFKKTTIVAMCLAAFAFNANAKQVLNLGAYGGSTETLFKEMIIPPFEEEHDVQIVYVAGNSTDTLAKLVAQKNNPEFDVVLIDDGPLAQAVQFDLCGKIEDA